MRKYSAVGKASSRVDGADKVSGRALYTADRSLGKVAWGKVFRSPIPHARITRVDVSKVKRSPGVLAVLTAADVTSHLFGRQLRDMPVLARDRVRFIGEKVVAIAAESPDLAEEAATLVDLEYEELPAVFDPLKAMAEGAPILHEDFSGYLNAPCPPSTIPNVHSEMKWHIGDCERGFAESDFVFEQTFTTQRSHQGYLEPHACLTACGPERRISIWSANKVPFQSKRYFSELVEIDPEQVLLHLSPVGGDFGGKGSLMDIPIAYYLAKATGRPVKMVMTYGEELTAGNPRHPSIISIKTGVKRNGKLWARKVQMIFDSGAYAAFKPNATINLPGARHAAGAYAIPNVLLEAFSVYTNQVPSGHMRGPGDPQVHFAVESHTDYIARQLNMKPFELRRANVAGSGDPLPSGHAVDTNSGKKLLETVHRKTRRAVKRNGRNLFGRGLAFGLRDIGPGEANVEVGLKNDGRAYLLTTVTDTGAGAHTTLRQIVAEILGIGPTSVEVVVGNTDSFNTDIALGGSRVTYMAGKAAALAGSNLQQNMRNIAAQRWHCAPESIVNKNGTLIGPGTHRIFFGDLAKGASARGIPLRELGHFEAKDRSGTLFFFAQLAEVEVDPDTGELIVLGITSFNDVGTIIHPLIHQAQIEGGVIQGLGYGVMEHLEDCDGKITTASLGEYRIPSIRDIPRIETVNIRDSTGPGPFQSKPIGENTVTPTAAAIGNAVYDAIGIQIKDLPITSEKIYLALNHHNEMKQHALV